MPVNTKHPDLIRMMKRYVQITDCMKGAEQVKSKTTKYLPYPSLDMNGKPDTFRYNQYIERAVFYNVLGRTLNGLVGQVFIRDPAIEVPDSLNPLVEDAEGNGKTLVQVAKDCVKACMSVGRCGLLADFPTVQPGTISRADAESGNYRPIIKYYSADKIINWRTTVVGSKEKLSLVVLEEEYVQNDDGYQITKKKQWRVLRLEDGVYTVTIYREELGDTPYEGPLTPVQSGGSTFDFIPFTFVGSENNSPDINEAPMYDLSELNIAHYRNSADYEESVFIVGQPTVVVTGLTEAWVKNQLQGTVRVGARGVIPLPIEATASYMQVTETTMAKEAMDAKEKQMVALGARLVENREVERTATEADQDASSQSSVLSSVVQNVSAAVTQVLTWAGMFTGNTEKMEFALNKDFDLMKLTPEERKQLLAEWQAGALAWTEFREVLQRGGIATLDDDEAKQLIESEQTERLTMIAETAIAQNAGNTEPSDDE